MGTGQVIQGEDDGGLNWSSGSEAVGRCMDLVGCRWQTLQNPVSESAWVAGPSKAGAVKDNTQVFDVNTWAEEHQDKQYEKYG